MIWGESGRKIAALRVTYMVLRALLAKKLLYIPLQFLVFRLFRLPWVWSSPAVTGGLTLLAGLTVLLFSLQANVLLTSLHFSQVIGLIADARAFVDTPMASWGQSLLHADHPIFLLCVSLADFVPASEGYIIVLAKAISAFVLLMAFMVFSATRLSVGAAIVTAVLLMGWLVNPLVVGSDLPIAIALVLAVGFFLAPVRDNKWLAIVEGIIGALLVCLLLIAGGVWAACSLMAVTTVAIRGGPHRGIRYLISVFPICVFLLGMLAANDLSTAYLNLDGGIAKFEMISPYTWLMVSLLLTIILCFRVRAPFYRILYNQSSFGKAILSAGIAIFIGVFSFMRVSLIVQDLSVQNSMFPEKISDNAIASRFHVVSVAKAPYADEDFMSGLKTAFSQVPSYAEESISILLENDLACILYPNRTCAKSGYDAARSADFVIVPREYLSWANPSLIVQSQGLLYSEFKRLETLQSDDTQTWDIWQRRDRD